MGCLHGVHPAVGKRRRSVRETGMNPLSGVPPMPAHSPNRSHLTAAVLVAAAVVVLPILSACTEPTVVPGAFGERGARYGKAPSPTVLAVTSTLPTEGPQDTTL